MCVSMCGIESRAKRSVKTAEESGKKVIEKKERWMGERFFFVKKTKYNEDVEKRVSNIDLLESLPPKTFHIFVVHSHLQLCLYTR